MTDKDLKVLWYREKLGWMGSHSGYDLIFNEIEKQYPDNYKSVLKKRLPFWKWGLVPKLIAKVFTKKADYNPYYNIYSLYGELETIIKSLIHKPKIIHVTHIEDNLATLSTLSRKVSNNKVIGTVHAPVSWWKLIHKNPEYVSELDALIVLSNDQLEYFNCFLPNKVYFIPHGVDTNFFLPNNKDFKSDNKKITRCVYTGKWLRDTTTMAGIIDNVLTKNKNIRFDMIVPRDVREMDPAFYHMARHKEVHWHAGLSDIDLLKIYNDADLLVLPLIDCAANNAILEAMSCGLPIITNNIGGIKDYTKSTFAELFPVGNVDGMTNSLLKLIDDPKVMERRGRAARKYAEDNFSLDHITKRTIEVYDEILSN